MNSRSRATTDRMICVKNGYIRLSVDHSQQFRAMKIFWEDVIQLASLVWGKPYYLGVVFIIISSIYQLIIELGVLRPLQ